MKKNFAVRHHIEHAILPKAHTAMYVWHKYWGRKPWNIVREYIERYSPVGGVVLDPFCGSGVTALEALRAGRRAIAIDLNPVAFEIVSQSATPIAIEALEAAYERISTRCRKEIEALYTTKCHACKKVLSAPAFVRVRKEEELTLREVRYKCLCGFDGRKGVLPSSSDKALADSAQGKLNRAGVWYPDNQLYYPDGKPFREKQRYESLEDLFTPRNLLASALLMDAIEEESDVKIKKMLKIAFSSMIHLCTTMMPVRETRHLSGCWTQHSYWYAMTFLEQNVWLKFQEAMIGRQGLIKAKRETNEILGKVRIAKTVDDVFRGRADLFVGNDSCINLMKYISKKGFGVDYCFTDPPYNGSIQYGELSLLWNAWLGKGDHWIKRMVDNEVVENPAQEKSFENYHVLLRTSLRAAFDTLKPGAWMHLTFTNPETRYRNMTLNSAMSAGFDFEEIHHQEGARASVKSLLQPFGSVVGDFYLRFRKNLKFKIDISKEHITQSRFDQIVEQTAIAVILRRGEPTPYTSLVEEIDKALYKEGFFVDSALGKFDAKKTLQKSVGKHFQLVDAKIGNVSGKLWWVSEVHAKKIQAIPLIDRVEKVVVDLLHENYEISFTEAWEAVATKFPNSLTPDSSDIPKILDDYATQTDAGKWRLKNTERNRPTEHSEIISRLLEHGKRSGFEVHVGTREQREPIQSKGRRIKLGSTMDKAPTLKRYAKGVHKTILNIDVIWHKNGEIKACFEVEHTTSITSAIERVSVLEDEIPKFLIVPTERLSKVRAKLRLPHFQRGFTEGRWELVSYDQLERFLKRKYSKSARKRITKRTIDPAA